MRNLKKFLALVLAMMMTLSLMVTVNASSFKDDDDITKVYAEAIDVLTELGVVKGYGEDDPNEGKFLPKNNITRAEVAAIMYRIVTGDVNDANVHLYKYDSEFTDVNSDNWFAPYVNFCANNELVKGRGNGKFDPKANITGYEALVMILRAIGYNNPSEFTNPSTWRTKASGYGMKHRLTENIQEGSLGAFATREVVAEIMFKGLQAPMQNYSILTNYTTDLLVDASEVNSAGNIIYKTDVPNTLMYQTFKIVGKSSDLTFDKFGRPTVMWVKDKAGDTVENGGKYILNADKGANATVATTEGADEAKVSLNMTPVGTYADAVTECQLTKDVNGDKSIPWGAIVEVLNGNQTKIAADFAPALTGVKKATLDNTANTDKDDPDHNGLLDALHTTTKYIGATGRTTEIYKLDQKVWVKADNTYITDTAYTALGDGDKAKCSHVNLWVFVYIDTFLGKVTDTTPAIKDSADHVIKAATATVELGNKIADTTGLAAGTDGPLTLTLETEDYTKGELILVQTAGGGYATAVDELDPVDSPAKAPLAPIDVPATAGNFYHATDGILAVVADEKPTTQRVTVKATVGDQDNKMGIIGTDGKTYMASNTFLAGRVAAGNKTVLDEYYKDSNVKGSAAGNKGLTNNMIGKTFDLVLDQNGHIVGLKQVLTSNSSVGVITGVDSKRIGTGKYLSEIEAFMTDGTTQTFCVPKIVKKSDGAVQTLSASVDPDTTDLAYTFFSSASEAEGVWDNGDNMYGSQIGVGSLVKFANVTVGGESYWKIDDYDGKADVAGSDKFDELGAAPTISLNTPVGKVLASSVLSNVVKTGVTDTLTEKAAGAGNDRTIKMLDDKSVVFVTEYDYRYNAGDENEGGNTDMSYKVYNGFKNIPTIEATTGNGVVYQRLDKNPEYYLIGKADDCKDYIIKDQEKITVDDSYLLLSRGATYDEYSEYNVLKNGELTTLKVANGNDAVNAAIEATLTGTVTHENQLFVVTGRNSKGYVTSIMDTSDMASSTPTLEALLNANSAGRDDVQIAPDDTGSELSETANGIRVYGNSVLQLATKANGFLTIADGCKVKLVNRDLGSTSDITLNEAIRYSNGVDKGATADGTLPSHGMVFELNELGYVCALYVIDDWNAIAA